MIIRKLEMFNFRQFIGRQEIEFSADTSKNVTALIGVNTSGKTTIIRAFEWCLYGTINFDTKILLNDDIRMLMSERDIEKVYVKIYFEHNKNSYILTRTQEYECIDKTNSDVKIKDTSKNVTLEVKVGDGQTKSIVGDYNIEKSINRILPEDLEEYFFFGGERISSIANKKDLSKAVKGVMGLEPIEQAMNHLKTVVGCFNDMIDVSENENAKKLQENLHSDKEKLVVFEENLDVKNNEKKYWSDKEEEYLAKLLTSPIMEAKQLTEKIENCKKALKGCKEKFEKNKKKFIDAFNNKLYGYFGSVAIKNALSTIENVKDNVEGIPNMEQIAIDYLIKRGHCICGADLSKGTEAYEHIMAERRKLPPESIGTIINVYKQDAIRSGVDSLEYLNSVKLNYDDYRKESINIIDVEDEIRELTEKMNKVEDVGVREIEETRKESKIKCDELDGEITDIKSNIKSLNDEIGKIEDRLKKFAQDDVKNSKISKYLDYTKVVRDFFDKKYKGKESEVRTELTDKVNEIFKKMYHGNRTVTIDENYNVKYVGTDTDESDGLKAVKSFAFISALVSLAKENIIDDSDMKLGQEYPLVMDAPFSNVDEIHISNICKILPDAANQVIMVLMEKDWEHAEKQLENYVGKKYTISKDTETKSYIKEEM